MLHDAIGGGSMPNRKETCGRPACTQRGRIEAGPRPGCARSPLKRDRARFFSALAAALLLSSLFATTPAIAQQQVESDQTNLNSIIDTNILIDSSTFSQANTVATTITNSSSVSAHDFTQSAKISQINAIAIEATNNGSNNTGLNAQITNNTFDQTNDASTSITNAANIFAKNFTQSIQLSQINALSIGAANSGSINAVTGINAQINNNVFTQVNTGDSSNTNNGNVVGQNFTQSIQASQINALSIDVANSGSIKASDTGINAEIENNTFNQTNGAVSTNTNTGNISTDNFLQSTQASQINALGAVTIANSGSIAAGNIGINAVFNNNGFTQTNVITNTNDNGAGSGTSPTQVVDSSQLNVAITGVQITNSGSVFGGNIGIQSNSDAGTFLLNSGSISAGSGMAINTSGSSAAITNASGGVIAGFVTLGGSGNLFDNQTGGVFEARGSSDFGPGNDLFTNAGTVHTAADQHVAETTTFMNLEEFDNSGLISMNDGKEGDRFILDPPAGVLYVAQTGSTLAVDAKLGGPGSTSDIFQIDGSVTGKTAIKVSDTGPGGGAPNKAGIPVVLVNGAVNSNAFYLPGGHVDAGLFDYALFFVPGATNIFELKSGIGAGAFVLPQLTTATQDIWHITSDSWFDRTADLRTALYGHGGGIGGPAQLGPSGSPPYYVAPAAEYAGTGLAVPYPGLWARGSFTDLNRDDTAQAAFETATLNRDQKIGDFEGGFDFGVRDLLAPGDALIFGVLGGFVVSELDYNSLILNRGFQIQGGQMGGYATYIRGGLFVDTLVKDDILNIDSDVSYGTPGSLSANNIGVRTDTGYRFGALAGEGFFAEPLGTIAWVNSQIDDYTLGANRVNFDDGNSVRGRLGLRLGTSVPWGKLIFEPFVIGSIWHEFESGNKVLLTSTGAVTFNLVDSIDETWGEVSAGANLFNVGAGASGFAKVDVAIGDNINSVGGQVGMRVKW
jgi:autotransporter family porin